MDEELEIDVKYAGLLKRNFEKLKSKETAFDDKTNVEETMNSGDSLQKLDFIIDDKGGGFSFPAANAFLQFPSEAVSTPVSITCRRVRYNKCPKTPKNGDVFCSSIIKIEAEEVIFHKPITVLLCHSAFERGAYIDYYDVAVQQLVKDDWEDLETERISKFKDLSNQTVSTFSNIAEYLPVVQSTIVEPCTLVAVTRIRSEEIVLQPDELFLYPKSYGKESKLEIRFPVDAVQTECRLNVQLLPPNKKVNDDLIHLPVLQVSGQKEAFLKPVEVELSYCTAGVADIDDQFLPVGKRLSFCPEFGVLLQSDEDPNCGETRWKRVTDATIKRTQKDRLQISFSVLHFCKTSAVVKKSKNAGVQTAEHNQSPVLGIQGVCLAMLEMGESVGNLPTLYAVLAPNEKKLQVKERWGSTGNLCNDPLEYNKMFYFCLPESDSGHVINLTNDNIRFYENEVTVRYNIVNSDKNVLGKHMHFLFEKCVEDKHFGLHCFGQHPVSKRTTAESTDQGQVAAKRCSVNTLESSQSSSAMASPVTEDSGYRGHVITDEELEIEVKVATTPGISSCSVDNPRYSYSKREIDEKTFHLVKARSLALQFMAANPTCVRAIPFSKDDNNKSMTMYLYMHTGCKGITAALRKRATEMLVGYTLEFVDLERRPLVKNVVLLPSNEKTKTEEMSKLAEIIDENLGVFENRLNVTAVQPSYKIVKAQETSDLCVTVFVLGKGIIPVGESDFSEVQQLSGYPYDIVEGYGIPTLSRFWSKAFPLHSGVGIGVEDQHEGTGTLGTFVEDEDGNHYILSCEHVLRPNLSGISDEIVQPSKEDYDEDLRPTSDNLKSLEEKKLDSKTAEEKAKWEERVIVAKAEVEFKKSTISRKIATYRCGVRGNVRKEISANVSKELWVDAALAELYPREEEEIRVVGFPKGMPKIVKIVAMRNIENEYDERKRFLKYGRTTGHTDGGELRSIHFHENYAGFKAETCFGIFTNVHFKTYCTHCSPEMGGEIIETSKINRKLTCAKCRAPIQKDVEKIRMLWAKNCFVIQKKNKPFSDAGDSGALVYDTHCKLPDVKHDKHDEHCLVNHAWGIITGAFEVHNYYLSIAISVEVALEALGEELGKPGKTAKILRLWCPEET